MIQNIRFRLLKVASLVRSLLGIKTVSNDFMADLKEMVRNVETIPLSELDDE